MEKHRTQSPAPPRGIWLAMSGGGLRAALFHYGALKRLYELDLLEDVTVISATSGGALIAALIGLHGPLTNGDLEKWENFENRFLSAATLGLLGPTMWSLTAWVFLLLSATAGLANLALSLWINNSPTLTTIFWVCFAACATSMMVTATWMHCATTRSSQSDHFGETRRLAPSFQTIKEIYGGIGERIRHWLNAVLLQLDPSYVRWHFLNHLLFRNAVMGDLNFGQKIFICAADLNSGRELVFSEKLLGELSASGSPRLWRQHMVEVRTGERPFKTILGENIAVATAVAASSALPPFLTAVPIFVDGRLVANCIDGGVIDNHALIIARQMAKYADEQSVDALGRTFANSVGHVLALDASSPIESYERFFWLRTSTLLRLGDVLHNRQIQGVLEDLDDIQRLFNVSAHAVGLRIGPDESCAFKNPLIVSRAARIRTHFDRFSLIECSVLAYLGYYWANRWATKEYSERKDRLVEVPMRGIQNVMPARFAPSPDELTERKILTHLHYSHLRVGIWRHICRFFAAT
jgi:predicted acylesterase/phospholipase RssA